MKYRKYLISIIMCFFLIHVFISMRKKLEKEIKVSFINRCIYQKYISNGTSP